MSAVLLGVAIACTLVGGIALAGGQTESALTVLAIGGAAFVVFAMIRTANGPRRRP